MNANILVDLLLELNVINAQDIDREINKLAARLTDPRAKAWFKRVPRFFLLNIDRLLKDPYVAKAEPRGHNSSKYYYHPQGGWVKGRAPEQPGSPLPVRETYDPAKKTYTTALHEPVVQRDIEQSFAPFKPGKAKANRRFGEPPTKKELQPWMTAPETKAKELHHFNPIQTRRRELFLRLDGLVNYLNYQTRLAQLYQQNRNTNLATLSREDQVEIANGQEAEKMLRGLVQMRMDDVEGFRDIMKTASDFRSDVSDKPWLFTKDGKVIAQHDRYTLRKTIFPETVRAFSRRAVDPQLWQTGRLTKSETGDEHWPTWCTKGSYADTYVKQGPLYFADRDDKPYVLCHFESGQVKNVYNVNATAEEAANIAPLFLDAARFPTELLRRGSDELADAVEALRAQGGGAATGAGQTVRGRVGRGRPA